MSRCLIVPCTMLSRMFVYSFLVLVLSTAQTWAADPYQPVQSDPALESWRWRSFPELKGLGLLCMTEDKDGRMWFGVDDGVRVYDGVNWTTYTSEDGLLGELVRTLCATRDRSVYAGTLRAGGISRFKDGYWSRVFPSEGEMPWIFDLMEASDGSLWAGTWWGVLHLSQEGATIYTIEDCETFLRAVAPDARLSIVPDEVILVHPLPEGNTSGIVTAREVIWGLASGGPGEKAGLKLGDQITAVDGKPDVSGSRLNGPAGTSVKLTVQRKGQPELFEATVIRKQAQGTYRYFGIWDVYEDRSGAMWFGAYWGEILQCDIQKAAQADPKAWQLYTEEDGLYIDNTPRILQTQDGAIWKVSGGNAGVNRFDGKTWTHFLPRELLGVSNLNPSILETKDGTLWVGGNGSLISLRNGVWAAHRPPDVPIPRVRVTDLLETSDGALWVAGRGQEAVRLDCGTTHWAAYEGLHFQCEAPDGALWFTSQDSGVVNFDGSAWTRYGREDGLMDLPRSLIATRRGDLWAAGRHDSLAATARFDGKRWSLETHPELSHDIDQRAVYEAADGGLWFGAAVNRIAERGQLGGVLQFDGKTWTHDTPPEALTSVYGIGQTADGLLWFGGGGGLRHFDRKIWTRITEPEEFTTSYIDVVYTPPKGDLWVGTRYYGAFYLDGETWTRYDVQDGLADSRVRSILRTDDGSVWVGTTQGVSRFDGQSWTAYALPLELTPTIGGLRQSRDGALWINHSAEAKRLTTRYKPDTAPPETEVTVSVDKVSQPGNTVFAWKGADPWKDTSNEQIQYSYRLDEGDWSPFSLERYHIFLSLPVGSHTFEVRARDRDFNTDPTPAAFSFTVVP